MSRGGILAVLNGEAARNALDAARPYEARLQLQFDYVKASALDELIENPNAGGGLLKATRIVLFCQSWLALRQAHDAASLGKQFKYKAWWYAAQRSVRDIGIVIDRSDTATYTNRRNRLFSLGADYL